MNDTDNNLFELWIMKYQIILYSLTEQVYVYEYSTENMEFDNLHILFL